MGADDALWGALAGALGDLPLERAEDAAVARELADRALPAAAIVDLRRTDGAELARAWRGEGRGFPILVVAGPGTAHLAALRGGADDYLRLPFAAEVLRDRLDTSLRTRPGAAVVALSGCTLDLERNVVARGGVETHLSATESRLLGYLAELAGRSASVDQLLVDVWGYRQGVFSRTVVTTVQRVRNKIEPDPARPIHLVTVPGVGYRLELDAGRSATPPRCDERTNLAPDATSFVGRDDVLAALERQLRSGGRLVTLTGPGGVGKTRLARELGLGADLSGGAWFVDLAASTDAEDVLDAVARALELPAAPDRSAQVAAALLSRGPCLVVLDNCEQALAPVAGLAGAWLAACPEVVLLATSRAPLGLPEEARVPVAPLAPAAAEELFAHRARAARRGVALPDADRSAARAIAARLDGLPLAIELAAARSRTLTATELLERLDRRFALLTSRSGGGPARQETLEATIRWSWDLLTDEQRVALVECAVFAGAFDLEGAERVLGAGAAAIDRLDELADRSLLQVGDRAFRLLESVRAFAREQLPEARGQAELRHARWLAEAFSRTTDADRPDGARRLDALLDDAVLAWDRVAERDPCLAARLVVAAAPLLARRSAAATRRWVDRALALPLGAEDRAQLLRRRGESRLRLGDTGGVEDLREALSVAEGTPTEPVARLRWAVALRGIGRLEEAAREAEAAVAALDGPELGVGLVDLAAIRLQQGRAEEAHALGTEALTRALREGNPRLELLARGGLALVGRPLGRDAEAEAHLLVARELARRFADANSEAILLGNLANLRFLQGRVDEARGAWVEAGALQRWVGNRVGEAFTLVALAFAELGAGALDEAQRLLVQARALHRSAGNVRAEGYAAGGLGRVLHRRGSLREALACYDDA